MSKQNTVVLRTPSASNSKDKMINAGVGFIDTPMSAIETLVMSCITRMRHVVLGGFTKKHVPCLWLLR